MLVDHNHLRSHRKKSELFLSDIAFLLDTSDISILSRYEKNLRGPSLPFLLLYHVLFDTPIEEFFSRQKDMMRELLAKRIPVLVDNLRSSPPGEQTAERIAFLESVEKRISPGDHGR